MGDHLRDGVYSISWQTRSSVESAKKLLPQVIGSREKNRFLRESVCGEQTAQMPNDGLEK